MFDTYFTLLTDVKNTKKPPHKICMSSSPFHEDGSEPPSNISEWTKSCYIRGVFEKPLKMSRTDSTYHFKQNIYKKRTFKNI